MVKYLPLFSAFIGAIVAQVLSHWFSLKREKEKEAKTIYQEIIAPNLYEILSLLETQIKIPYKKGYVVEKKIDIQNIITNISIKISYGNSKLMSSVLKHNSLVAVFDEKEKEIEASRLSICFFFLDYSLDILKSSKIEDDVIYSYIKSSQKLYGIWTLLTDIFGLEQSTRIMHNSKLWSKRFLNNYTCEVLEGLILANDINSEDLSFLISVLKDETLEITTDNEIIDILDKYLLY
ncbi:hypothetical protein MHH96_21825 [Niallia sp. FSL K6-0212]|uniref:hypothetical protein n=1 Tax=Niallia sp. FSL K6-0212 TaxID=2921423 RepID=UPI0030F7F2C2